MFPPGETWTRVLTGRTDSLLVPRGVKNCVSHMFRRIRQRDDTILSNNYYNSDEMTETDKWRGHKQIQRLSLKKSSSRTSC